MTKLSRRGLLGGSVALFGGGPARAAGYPERPVRIVAPFAPGGPTDLIARVVAARLGDRLGGSFFVENRVGAGGNIGAAVAAKADPNGYTLLVTSSALVVNPSLYKHVPYDPVKDFAPLSVLGAAPNIFVANPAAGLASMAQLVAKAKADPTAITFATAGIGTTPHLSAELLELEAGIRMTHLPFNGAGPATQAVLAGTTPVACASIPPVLQLVRAGSLVPLAVTSEARWPDLPDVPTMIELGYAGFLADTFQAFLAPAATPPAILDVLAQTTAAILADKAVHAELQADGFDVGTGGPAGLARRIADEVPKWQMVIMKAGLSVN